MTLLDRLNVAKWLKSRDKDLAREWLAENGPKKKGPKPRLADQSLVAAIEAHRARTSLKEALAAYGVTPETWHRHQRARR